VGVSEGISDKVALISYGQDWTGAVASVSEEPMVNEMDSVTEEGRAGILHGMKLVYAILVILGIFTAINLGAVLGTRSRSACNVSMEGENSFRPDDSSNATQHLLEVLLPYTSKALLLDPEVPQGRAFAQLVEQDGAVDGSSEDSRVKRRYALMCLAFSTDYESWPNHFGWDGFTKDECSWYGVTCRNAMDGRVVTSELDLCKCSRNGMRLVSASAVL
jgi:hypothetical protein